LRCRRKGASTWGTRRSGAPLDKAALDIATNKTDANAAGASLLYLPPYSPDFNPIENAFPRLKAMMRAKAERTTSALWKAVRSIVDLFTPAECANYFRAAGYDPD
jgi:transposase